MLNDPLLKLKLPQANSNEDLVNRFNYMVKAINSSFRDKKTTLNDLGNSFVKDYTYGAGSFSVSITISHGLGVTPSGFMVLYIKPTTATPADRHGFYLNSMDDTSIVIDVKGTILSGDTGEYKFLILR